MNKRIFLCILLLSLLLTGCAQRTTPLAETAPPVAEPTSENAALTPEPTAEPVAETSAPTSEPTPESAAPTAETTPETSSAQPDDELYAILQGIYESYHPGSAGSSLSAAARAAALLDWYAARPEAELARATAERFAAEWDVSAGYVNPDGIPVDFPDKLSRIEESARQLLSGDLAILDDAGYAPLHAESWTSEGADELFTALYEGLGIERA